MTHQTIDTALQVYIVASFAFIGYSFVRLVSREIQAYGYVIEPIQHSEHDPQPEFNFVGIDDLLGEDYELDPDIDRVLKSGVRELRKMCTDRGIPLRLNGKVRTKQQCIDALLQLTE